VRLIPAWRPLASNLHGRREIRCLIVAQITGRGGHESQAGDQGRRDHSSERHGSSFHVRARRRIPTARIYLTQLTENKVRVTRDLGGALKSGTELLVAAQESRPTRTHRPFANWPSPG
jgi:hypothetical protein